MVDAHSAAFATRCIHAGQKPDKETGAIMTPIYMSSTFVQDGPGNHKGYEYSRTQNPTRKALEQNLAALEGGQYGLCFASGCAATSAVLSCLCAGDHVIAADDLYGGTYRLFTKVFSRLGIQCTFVDLTNPSALERHVQPNTKLIWIETPTNPLLKLVDIAAIAKIAKAHDTPLAVDNTFATPYLQQPLALGADLVVHSTTKYLSGHSDVIGGAIITNRQDWAEQIAFVQNAMGAIPSPMDVFLVLRGLKTLHLRMERHVQNAKQIAEYLSTHKGVENVIFPGLSSHPQHDLSKRQMAGPGGMISFTIKGGQKAAIAFLKATRLFSCAESLGGVESLIEHPGIMTHAAIAKEVREKLGISDGLIRLSVGVEDVSDLQADLRQAFQIASPS